MEISWIYNVKFPGWKILWKALAVETLERLWKSELYDERVLLDAASKSDFWVHAMYHRCVVNVSTFSNVANSVLQATFMLLSIAYNLWNLYTCKVCILNLDSCWKFIIWLIIWLLENLEFGVVQPWRVLEKGDEISLLSLMPPVTIRFRAGIKPEYTSVSFLP